MLPGWHRLDLVIDDYFHYQGCPNADILSLGIARASAGLEKKLADHQALPASYVASLSLQMLKLALAQPGNKYLQDVSGQRNEISGIGLPCCLCCDSRSLRPVPSQCLCPDGA